MADNEGNNQSFEEMMKQWNEWIEWVNDTHTQVIPTILQEVITALNRLIYLKSAGYNVKLLDYEVKKNFFIIPKPAEDLEKLAQPEHERNSWMFGRMIVAAEDVDQHGQIPMEVKKAIEKAEMESAFSEDEEEGDERKVVFFIPNPRYNRRNRNLAFAQNGSELDYEADSDDSFVLGGRFIEEKEEEKEEEEELDSAWKERWNNWAIVQKEANDTTENRLEDPEYNIRLYPRKLRRRFKSQHRVWLKPHKGCADCLRANTRNRRKKRKLARVAQKTPVDVLDYDADSDDSFVLGVTSEKRRRITDKEEKALARKIRKIVKVGARDRAETRLTKPWYRVNQDQKKRRPRSTLQQRRRLVAHNGYHS